MRKNLCADNALMQKYLLKMYQIQMPYLSRKWKQSNMKILSSMFVYLRPRMDSTSLNSISAVLDPVAAKAEEDLLLKQIEKYLKE